MSVTPETKSSQLTKNLLWVVIGVIIGIIFVNSEPWLAQKLHRELYSKSEGISEPSPDTIRQDSVLTSNGKVPRSVFESDFSAESWYQKFSANKVAFDQSHKDSVIDVYGTIVSIDVDYDCTQVKLSGDSKSGFDVISCTNCPENKDKWKKEVIELTKGSQIHIRGLYSPTLSSEFEFCLFKCHVINQ
ncbi:MAG TPA: hypothetical protein VL442_06745 [Mucilaginibacter sp.]|nr:hypothetical protein [Mucilaginibacter sp.]